MTTVHKLQNSSIIKKDTNKYEIHIKNISDKYSFWNNLFMSPILQGIPHSINNDDNDGAVISINANSVNTLREFLKNSKNLMRYDQTYTLFKDIMFFLKTLEKDGFTIPYFSLHDFVVFYISKEDDSDKGFGKLFFLLLNDENVMKINEERKTLSINFPPSDYQFVSPEFLQIDSIPTEIHKNSMLFSLASLCSFCLTNKNILNKEQLELDETEFIENNTRIINVIKDTNLFWSFIRCLEKDPERRIYVLI